MYGYFDLSLETHNFGNRITCFTKGINTIDFFKINEKIYLSIPSSQIVNAIAKDDRSAHYVGVMIFYDIKNKLIMSHFGYKGSSIFLNTKFFAKKMQIKYHF